MENNAQQQAYQRYVETASKYTTPLSFEEWLKEINHRVFDVVAGC